jgi:hypothetical protein
MSSEPDRSAGSRRSRHQARSGVGGHGGDVPGAASSGSRACSSGGAGGGAAGGAAGGGAAGGLAVSSRAGRRWLR